MNWTLLLIVLGQNLRHYSMSGIISCREHDYLPELPIEVWENVIDLVRGKLPLFVDRPAGRNRHNHVRLKQLARQTIAELVACSAVCRTWNTRARLYLFESITLRSGQDLLGFLHHLSNSLILRGRVRALIISNEDSCGDSWIYRAVHCLPSRLPNAKSLTLRHINLATLHPHFMRDISLFRPLQDLYLVHAVFPRFVDLWRLVSSTRAEYVQLTRSCKVLEQPGSLFRRPSTLQSRMRFIWIRGAWSDMKRMSRTWDFSSPLISDVRVSILPEYEEGLPVLRTSCIWKEILRVFRQLCATAAPERKPVWVELTWMSGQGIYVSLSRGLKGESFRSIDYSYH